jgi:hypothetical protein
MATEKKDDGVAVPTTKENIDMVESGSSSDQEVGFTAQQTKALIRKMDWALLPFLALLYLLSFLDRSTSYPILSNKPSESEPKNTC